MFGLPVYELGNRAPFEPMHYAAFPLGHDRVCIPRRILKNPPSRYHGFQLCVREHLLGKRIINTRK